MKEELKGAPKLNWVANYHKAKEFLFATLGRVAFWTAVFSAAALLFNLSPAAFAVVVLVGLGTGLLLELCLEWLLDDLNFRKYEKWWYEKWYDENVRRKGSHTLEDCSKENPKTPRVLTFSTCHTVVDDPVRENPCLRTHC